MTEAGYFRLCTKQTAKRTKIKQNQKKKNTIASVLLNSTNEQSSRAAASLLMGTFINTQLRSGMKLADKMKINKVNQLQR